MHILHCVLIVNRFLNVQLLLLLLHILLESNVLVDGDGKLI